MLADNPPRVNARLRGGGIYENEGIAVSSHAEGGVGVIGRNSTNIIRHRPKDGG
jgi:hypothetical protein